MRFINSVKNSFVAIITNIVTVIIGLIAQKILLNILGLNYSGINGLFTNILSMLSIAELGFGTAIIYSLYKPIAENNKEKIKTLIDFYKKTYYIIVTVIIIIGVCFIPFLDDIVGQVNINENIILIYILFLLDTVASYLLTYKRSMLYADQKTYITNLVHIGYLIIMNILQILILVLTKNFILYLITKIVCRILENMVITIITNKMYPFLKEKSIREIDKKTKNEIMEKVKGLLFHKIGSFMVLGTDNIIISKFLGIATVGLYYNYNLIINAANNLVTQIFSSITASVGNLLTENNRDKSYKIYKSMLFANSWIYAFAGTGIICMMDTFIKLWIGEEYILPFGVLIVLVLNFYIQGMRKTCNTFKEAAGIFYEDRYVPIIESIVNIIASIILVKKMGLAGVFMGTILSNAVLFLFSYPKFVYKKIFKRKYGEFFKDYIIYAIITFISIIMSVIITRVIKIENTVIQLFINGLVVLLIPNLVYALVFYKTEEFKYYYNLIKDMIRKRKSIKTM